MLTCVTNPAVVRIAVVLISTVLVGSSFNIAQVRPQPKVSRPSERREKEQREKREAGEQKERQFDDPAKEAELNRELWEFARGTPYDQIRPYVEGAQWKSKASQINEVELPT